MQSERTVICYLILIKKVIFDRNSSDGARNTKQGNTANKA